MLCYRNFTALSENDRKKLKALKRVGTPPECLSSFSDISVIEDSTENCSTNVQPSPLRQTRSASNIKSDPRTGVLLPKCIYCEKSDKRMLRCHKREKLVLSSSDEISKSILRCARTLEDNRIFTLLGGSDDFIAKEVRYHPSCDSKFRMKAQHVLEKKNKSQVFNEENDFIVLRAIHKKAFEFLTEHIQQVVIDKREVHRMNDIKQHYMSLVTEIGGKDWENLNVYIHKIKEKLLDHFKDRLTICMGFNMNEQIIFNSQLNPEEVISKENCSTIRKQVQIKNSAFFLRNVIMKANKQYLNENITISDVHQGEVEIPEEVLMFYKNLIHGPRTESLKNKIKHARVRSLSADAVFCASNGNKKPAKHLEFGLALKAMSGSKKILNICNRLGHCASYHTVCEIENEIVLEATSQGLTTPVGANLDSVEGTGVAFDNNDRFVATTSGRDTLHDTVGIFYQPQKNNEIVVHEAETTANSSSQKRRKRAYRFNLQELEAYRKRPRVIKKMLPLDDTERLRCNEIDLSKKKRSDFLWMVSNVVKSNTPMWGGWNSKYTNQIVPQHKIFYLPQIKESPTCKSVVLETLKRAQRIAEECHLSSINVTYDLNIAKDAFAIQCEESPTFDNIFISLGSFHIEGSFFNAIGKIIAGSGCLYILVECEVLAGGSVSCFLAGKSYNRCKRIHELLSLAMEILHFQFFLQKNVEKDIKDVLINSTTDLDLACDIECFETSAELSDVILQYEKFKDLTRCGAHGKTAQFWMAYIDAVTLYHDFCRSHRAGDFDLFRNCIPKMASYFFALNNLNYARWICHYLNNLLLIDRTHPSVYEDFKNGMFAIARTKKSFSRQAIDLTLEQTVNKDAANGSFGIGAFTNNISARQRWADGHFAKMTIVTNLMDELNLTKNEDITEGLKTHRIKRDQRDLEKIKQMIVDNINPFNPDLEKDKLFNISTGKAASEDTQNFLLNVMKIGKDRRDTFIEECAAKNERFHERINRVKINNFQKEGIKVKAKKKNKTVEIELTRDLFGRCLYLALQNKIDMAEVLKFPCIPCPLSMCHPDGTMLKTAKATLLHYLENMVNTIPPTVIYTTLIDGMFYLYLLIDLPITFGGIARRLIKHLACFEGEEIHFVTDQYRFPSIKDSEWNARYGCQQESFHISGPHQKRPNDWKEHLRNPSFKTAFINFLVEIWKEDDFKYILNDKVLYINSGNICYKFYTENGKWTRSIVDALYNEHEEADSRIIYHLCALPSPNQVVIRASDTDVLIIALGCFQHLKPDVLVWLDLGLSSKNSRRYVSVNQIHFCLGDLMCSALPAFHAWTGCDYMASFSHKGKIRPFKHLERNINAQIAFAELGRYQKVNEEIFEILEHFLCQVYGKSNVKCVDDARFDIFGLKYKNKRGKNLLSVTKGIDAGCLPPCSKVLKLKTTRANYVAFRWRRSCEKTFSISDPHHHGWEIGEDGRYKIKWFDGAMAPSSLEEITVLSEDEEDDFEDIEDSSDDEDDDDD